MPDWSGPMRLTLFIVLMLTPAALAGEPKRQTENVILVMSDGVRWQEMFGGADDELLNKERGGVEKIEPLKKLFGTGTREQRREALSPFVWTEMAKNGQIYGNQWKKSTARIANGLNFSYPGYSEILCGFVDPRINSNAKRNNPNVTVLEWLNEKPAYSGKVAAFTTWDVFPFIINSERSKLLVNVSPDLPADLPATPSLKAIKAMMDERKQLGEEARSDAFTFAAAMDYIAKKKPRVLFLSLDETDERCHEGRYDRYLTAANKADRFVQLLWETIQTMPEYKGKTTLIFTCDHGRGDPPVGWKSHGRAVKGSEFTWMAFMGPDTPALGERSEVPPVSQAQVAATLAVLLGEDYCAAEPKAAKPVGDVLKVVK